MLGRLEAEQKMKKKLIVNLCGGLGNQMFQYAAARSLAERNSAELVLDTWSGFVRDFQYQRHYELNVFPIVARKARAIERLPFWIDRISNKIVKSLRKEIRSSWYGTFLNETRLEYLPEVASLQIIASCWMTGYWQSFKYFLDHEPLLLKELSPPKPSESHIRDLGNKMREVNSVALGVRLYEESANPGAHAAHGHLKSVASINKAVLTLSDRQTNCHFFIFCTHRSPILDQLELGANITFVTHDDGYNGTLQRLWLLTQCRHHLMTNSSYYWWGAWLSRKYYDPEEQEIFAADNFINKDSELPQWQLF
jgi:hypothetical protein